MSSPLPGYEPVPVVPVATPDELAELFDRLIEEADDPVEIERSPDGVLRFATRPPKYSAGVLADRAQAVLAGSYVSAWSGEDVLGRFPRWSHGSKGQPSAAEPCRGRLTQVSSYPPTQPVWMSVPRWLVGHLERRGTFHPGSDYP